jgi:hypothetical protein
MFSISNLFAKRSARQEFSRAKSDFAAAAASLVEANRAARASGETLSPEMEAASEHLARMQQRLLKAKAKLDQLTGGPPSVALTEAVSREVRAIFQQEQQQEAIRLLEKECGRNLPFRENAEPQELDRVRLAVVKLSGGNIDELRSQIEVAKRDWRDVMLSAG